MEVSNLFINKGILIREAIEKLDKTAKRILIVVENNKLVGVITDGDIRRWILKNGDLSESVDKIMTTSPIYLPVENKNLASQLMKKHSIEAIPILNKDNDVIDVAFWNDLNNSNFSYCETNNVPIVIMAGGKGTRLQPYTKVIPKLLIPIGDTTIVERIINNFLEFEFNDFYLAINYKKELIKAYFSRDLSYNITFLEEDKPLGTAGSLSLLKNKINKTLFVSNCDILVDANYSRILNHHRKCKNKITVVTALKNYVIPYGIFNLDEKGNIRSLDEKPNYEFLVNTGMYILESEVLEYIPENEYYDMTSLIECCLLNGEKIGTYPVTEKAWLDMGEFESMKNMIERLGI